MEARHCPSEFDPKIPSANAQFASLFIYLDQPFGVVASLAGTPLAFDPSLIYLKIRLPKQDIAYDVSVKPIHEQVNELLELHPILKEITFAELIPGSFIALKWSAMNSTPYNQILDYYTYHSLDIPACTTDDVCAEHVQTYLSKGVVNVPNPYQNAFEASFILMHQIKHPFQQRSQFDNVCRLLHLPLCDIHSVRNISYVLEHQQDEAVRREGSFTATMQLLIDVLYCRYLRNMVTRYFADRQGARQNPLMKLHFTLPFINGRRNESFQEFSFLEMITEADARQVIRDLQSRTLAQLQQMSPKCYLICELFEQEDEIYKSLCDSKLSLFSPVIPEHAEIKFQDEIVEMAKIESKKALDRINQMFEDLITQFLIDRPDRAENQFSKREGDIFPVIADIKQNFTDYGLLQSDYEQLFVNTHYYSNVHDVARGALNRQFHSWCALPRIGWFQSGHEGQKDVIRERLGHLWGFEQEIIVKTVEQTKKKWELS